MGAVEDAVICRGCGKAQTWIPIYRRYYCYTCKTYPPVCPRCFWDLSWVPRYEKYYCYRCQEYPEFREEEKKPYSAEQVAVTTALLEAPRRRGVADRILNFIDRLSAIAQKAVGGFPRGQMPRSPSMYASPPALRASKTGKYVVIGFFLIFLTSLLLFSASWLAYFGLFVFSFIGPAIYLAWMWKTDRYEREPRTYLFTVFAMGFFTAIPAYVMNSYITGPLIGGLSAPVVEEVLKGLCVLWMARKEEFNDAMDGIVYGFAAGMGFAAAENFFYIIAQYEGNLILAILRVFLWGFGHGLYTAMTGRWLGKMKVLTGIVKRRFLVPGLLVAVAMHYIYNEVAGAFIPILGNIVWEITALLIVLAAVRQALAEERLWGYDKGLAPIPVRL